MFNNEKCCHISATPQPMPVVNLKEPTKKEVEMVTSDKKLKVKVNNKQVEEEEQGEIYNISHDIFSNEMIIIAVIIAIVILCMN